LDQENKLFVGMLPKTFSEAELQDLFHSYGELREIHIIRSTDGSPKGCAFVKFLARESALTAIENLNDTIPTVILRSILFWLHNSCSRVVRGL
jgi:RNA recognition motif-containing protein